MNAERVIERLQGLYAEGMYKVALSIIKDTHLAEDIVQDAFVRILKNTRNIRAPEDQKTRSFLFTITKNIAIDYYRKHKNGPLSMDPQEYTPYTQEPADTSDKETRFILEELLLTLSPLQRDLLKLKYMGYSAKEIAELTGENYDTVRKRIYRAQVALQALLKE